MNALALPFFIVIGSLYTAGSAAPERIFQR